MGTVGGEHFAVAQYHQEKVRVSHKLFPEDIHPLKKALAIVKYVFRGGVLTRARSGLSSRGNQQAVSTGNQREVEMRRALTSIDPLFHFAGQEEGFEAWRVEGYGIKLWPVENYGRFFLGDHYLVLHTKRAQSGDCSWLFL